MGTVYRVKELGLERELALKLLQPGLISDDNHRARFHREGKVLSELDHCNLLRVFRFGIWQGLYPYIVMEYLQGSSLRSVLDSQGCLPWQRVIGISTQVCQSMTASHNAGIVHRDLKPDNIMLLPEPCTDFVKILDFGLARVVADSSKLSQHLTQTGALVGSVFYMSPEQCTGKKADHRSDIYALGCILFEMITGDPPFSADNPIGLMHKHTTEPIPPLSAPLPDGLEKIVRKAMEKNMDKRYQSMLELEEDLRLISENRGAEIIGIEATDPKAGPKLLPILFAGLSIIVVTIVAISSNNSSTYKSPTTAASHQRTRNSLLIDSGATLRFAFRATDATLQKSDEEAIKDLLELLNKELDAISRISPNNRQLNLQAHLTRSWTARRLSYRSPDIRWTTIACDECQKSLKYAMVGNKPLRPAAAIYMALGEIALEMGDGKTAEDNFKRALDVVSNTMHSEAFTLDNRLPGTEPVGYRVYVKLMLGRCMVQTGRYAEAEKWLHAAIDEATETSGHITNHSFQAIQVLGAVLAKKNRSKETELIRKTEAEVKRELKTGKLKSNAACSFLANLATMAVKDLTNIKWGVSLLDESVALLDSLSDVTDFVAVNTALNTLEAQASVQQSNDIKVQLATLKQCVERITRSRKWQASKT